MASLLSFHYAILPSHLNVFRAARKVGFLFHASGFYPSSSAPHLNTGVMYGVGPRLLRFSFLIGFKERPPGSPTILRLHLLCSHESSVGQMLRYPYIPLLLCFLFFGTCLTSSFSCNLFSFISRLVTPIMFLLPGVILHSTFFFPGLLNRGTLSLSVPLLTII